MADKNSWLQWVTCVLAIATLALALGISVKISPVDYGKIQGIVEKSVKDLPEPEVPTAEEIAEAMGKTDNQKIGEIYDEVFKEDRTKAKAEELALSEIDSKDFKKDLAAFLESEIEEIEDITYKDITEISVRDIDTVLEDEEAQVALEFKVYMNNYGDEDEKEKARVEVTMNVEDLDPDEDFEDAEVEDWSDFELVRFY